jgi:ABC-type oligopeptide transport system substrate-binding subunit
MKKIAMKNTVMKKPLLSRCAIAACLISAAVLAGCSSSRSSSSSSSDDDDKTVVQAPNYAEQLLQLDEAHQKKLISDEDYNTQHEKILKAMKK